MVARLVPAIVLTVMMLQASAGADEAALPSRTESAESSAKSSADASSTRNPAGYKQLIDEPEAERKHVDELERRVKALESSNSELQQATTNLGAGDRQLVTQSGDLQKQVADIQKTVSSQLGPSTSAIG